MVRLIEKPADDLAGRITSITITLNKAEDALVDDSGSIAYYVELAFFELFVLIEKLNLSMLYSRVVVMYEEAKANGEFGVGGFGPDGPYLKWGDKVRMVLYSLGAMIGRSAVEPRSAELPRFLRESLYSITDKKCFNRPPQNEEEVHNRIELALRCAYPDMKRKPAISQPIKNFEPDTGIPSLRTLIEYKFVDCDTDAKRVADEILADTRAYEDPAWSQFIFVIYETKRFRSPHEWEDLMRRCGTADKADIIVLCGEDPAERKRRTPNSRQKPRVGGERTA